MTSDEAAIEMEHAADDIRKAGKRIQGSTLTVGGVGGAVLIGAMGLIHNMAGDLKQELNGLGVKIETINTTLTGIKTEQARAGEQLKSARTDPWTGTQAREAREHSDRRDDELRREIDRNSAEILRLREQLGRFEKER